MVTKVHDALKQQILEGVIEIFSGDGATGLLQFNEVKLDAPESGGAVLTLSLDGRALVSFTLKTGEHIDIGGLKGSVPIEIID